MTPEAVKEAARLLRVLDRSEQILQRVRTSDLIGVGTAYFTGPGLNDRLHLEVLEAEGEAVGISLSAITDRVRAEIDMVIDAQAAELRSRLVELGVDLLVRPVPLVKVGSDEALS